MEKKRIRSLAEGTIKFKYLIETVGNLIRSTRCGQRQTPFQLDNLNFDGLTQPERDLFYPSYKFLKKFILEAKKARALNSLAPAYLHFTYFDEESYKELLRACAQGLNEHDYDELRPFLGHLQYMLQSKP